MRVSWLRGAGLALVVGVGLWAVAGAAPAASGVGAVISGVLSDRASGAPLPGVTVRLGPGHHAVTDARGRFRFPGVATGVYRVIVTGACDEVPLRVDVRPGEDQEITAAVDRSCAEEARMAEVTRLPSWGAHDPWRTAYVKYLGPTSEHVFPEVGTAVGNLRDAPGEERAAVVAGPILNDPDLIAIMQARVARARPGHDWIALREPGCFFRLPQTMVLTREGELRVSLIPEPDGTGGPLLTRNLCAGCVDGFFDELERLDLGALSGRYRGHSPSRPGSITIGGVSRGQPFLVRTHNIRLSVVEAVRTRILDLCAYRGCVDPGEIQRFAADVTIDAPAVLEAGERFTVRARLAVSPAVVLSGAVLQLSVSGATHEGGEQGKGGVVSAGSPLEIAAQYAASEWAGRVDIRLALAAENAVPIDSSLALTTRTIRLSPR